MSDILRSAVKIIDSVTKSLKMQGIVTFRKAIFAPDGYSSITFDSPVQLRAIIDWRQKHLRTMTGDLSVSRASVMFLDLAALLAATKNEGISDKDEIILPDGTTGPILDMAGFIDDLPSGIPVATEVFLG